MKRWLVATALALLPQFAQAQEAACSGACLFDRGAAPGDWAVEVAR